MSRKLSRRGFIRGATLGIGGSLVTSAYADYCVRNPKLEERELMLPRWRANGLRVGFLSDTHVNDEDEMVRARWAAEQLAAAKPDIILLGGDYVNIGDGHIAKHVSESLEPFRNLSCPKLAVLGNHDYWCGLAKDVERELVKSDFRVLKNEVVHFDKYCVAGYDDRIGGKNDPLFHPEFESMISLMHEPDDVEIVPPTASLQLSGHSHGGQICLPFGIPVTTPKLARKYKQGFFPDLPVPLYVSRGIGTVGFKWRLFCPPEISLLTLRSTPQ